MLTNNQSGHYLTIMHRPLVPSCPKLPSPNRPRSDFPSFDCTSNISLLSKGGKSPEITSDSPIKNEEEKPFPIHWVMSKVPEALQHHDQGHPQPCSWVPRRFASTIMPGRRELSAYISNKGRMAELLPRVSCLPRDRLSSTPWPCSILVLRYREDQTPAGR